MSTEFDVAEYLKRFKIHSPEFAAHHNEVISHIPQHCPVFHANMEAFSPAPITVLCAGSLTAFISSVSAVASSFLSAFFFGSSFFGD